VTLGIGQTSVSARGDSTTALTWITSEHFRSGPSRRATICYMALGVTHDIHFARQQHIRGIDNVRCDALSRSSTPEMLHFNRSEVMNPSGCLDRLLDSCNPKQETVDYESLWQEAFAIAEALRQ